METGKIAGIVSIVLGLMFIVFPMFSSELVSAIVGVSLIFLGVSIFLMGMTMHSYEMPFSIVAFAIGAITVLLGIGFIFFFDALSFLVGFQFYIIGFIMIAFGITGLISRFSKISAFSSIIVLIMGVVLIALGAFAVKEPIFIAIIIGVVLIIEGVSFLLHS